MLQKFARYHAYHKIVGIYQNQEEEKDFLREKWLEKQRELVENGVEGEKIDEKEESEGIKS